MARLLAILLGAFLGAVCCYGIFFAVGQAFGPLYANEEDVSRNIDIFLVSTAFFVALGGWLGNRMLKRLGHRQSE